MSTLQAPSAGGHVQASTSDVKNSLLQNSAQKDSELTLRQQLSVVERGNSSIFAANPPSPSVGAQQQHPISSEDKIEMVKNWLSLRFDLVEDLLKSKGVNNQELLFEAWSDLLSVSISAYPSTDIFSRQHLRVVVEETANHILQHHKFPLTVAKHAELISFMAPISASKALNFLSLLPVSKWTDACHAMAYHLDWQANASSATIKAEQSILEATRFTMLDDQDDEFQYFDWNKASSTNSSNANLNTFSRHFEECASPTTNQDLQKQLKNSHWMSLRVKFETVWRSEIESQGVPSQALPKQSILFAFSLIEAITTLAIHFEQFEYCWYWSERANLPIKWALLQNLITACRTAAVEFPDEAPIWRARGWVLYKKVYDIPKAKLVGKQPYIDFMSEFTKFASVTESNENLLHVYPRIITDMLEHCSPTFFPLVEDISAPLLELCWKFRNEPREKWESSFRKMFEVYVLHKFYKTRRGSTFSKSQYFSPDRLVNLLALCTVAGFLDEFKILNKDILMAIAEKESAYVLAVQKGYTEFVQSTRDGVLPSLPSAVEVVPVVDERSEKKIAYDLTKLTDLLLDFLKR